MIAEIAVVGTMAGIVAVVGDHENWFGTNPLKLGWFWERPPFKAAPPAARMPYPSMIQRPMQLSPKEQLKRAETEILYANQVANEIKRQNPALTQSKYQVVKS